MREINVKEEAQNLYERMVSLRREFHAHPELSLREFETAERIERELDKLGIAHERVGETGVMGVIRGTGEGTAGRVVALRADMDALPIEEKTGAVYASLNTGCMHACGHDSHVTSLLGAAEILKRHEKDFTGEIRLCFQQGEEIGAGARIWAKSGALDGVYRVLGIHTAPDIEVGHIGLHVGTTFATVDKFTIEVQGVPAHAASPEEGVDALYIASQIVVNLQATVSRRTSPMEPVLMNIGTMQAGTSYNIVASGAVIEGTTRCINNEARVRVRETMETIAKSTVTAFGGSVTIKWQDFADPVINSEANVKEVSIFAENVLGAGAVVDRPMSMMGDDFCEFLKKVPGVYAFTGTGNVNRPETRLVHHNDHFEIDEAGMVSAAALYAKSALEWLKQE